MPIVDVGGSPIDAPVCPSKGRLRPLGVRDVKLNGGFWGGRQELNGEAIIPHCEDWMERLGWVANFDEAAKGSPGDWHRGREFADADVYKLVEAMAWEHARVPRAGLEDRLMALEERIAAAQDDDGYLHTLFGRVGQRPRYSDFESGHELYCIGHLIQAALARARTSTDDRLLSVAQRAADHVCETFGPDGLNRVCGHAEIEPALVELYRQGGDRRYLAQAALFVERRGQGTLARNEFGPAYYQDAEPVRGATVLRGHAVRALYLAAGAVDVAVEANDQELLTALIEQWANTVAKRTYVTGGMGSHYMDEGFGNDYVLPADRSYCETCAGVGSIMFSWRLLLATGDARYADLIERTLFNIIATSPSADGRSFFYSNTLHQRSTASEVPTNNEGVCIRGASNVREAWFEVSCCPPNVARTLASLPGYVATVDLDGVQIHQYAAAEIRLHLDGRRTITLKIETTYPESGTIVIRVVEADGLPLPITLRVPDWAIGAKLVDGSDRRTVAPGYVTVRRAFVPGDELILELPIRARFTVPVGRIDAIRGCVAVERGPEVYCLESADLPGSMALDQVRVDPTIAPREQDGAVLLRGNSATLTAPAWPYGDREDLGERLDSDCLDIPVIPYHRWANRGASLMRVWIPTVEPGAAAIRSLTTPP